MGRDILDSIQRRRQHINLKMVFQSDPVEPSREMIIETAKVGNAVVKVVNKVDEAKESGVLDLSQCSLIQVPEAVYFILRAAEIQKCNLSNNLITKITPQFGGSCFLQLTSLDVSTNRLSTLPLELEAITDINAKSNFIAEVNDEDLESNETLEVVNLENNPLSPACHDRLHRVSRVRIIVSDKKLEEWEDLSI